MSRAVWYACIALLLILAGVTGATAQSTASISGVVKDTAGGVVPGVTVVIKGEGAGGSQEVITGADGRYQVSALPAGSYTVIASLPGFKTAVVSSLKLAPGQPVSVTLTLEVGSLSETVTVMSSAELINTETATVAATLNSDQLLRMPTATRNALNAIAFLPGVNTSGANRDSTINGLPETFVSITMDGVSNNDNFLRNTDGFFATVTPRQDAVEAVSVTLAAAGASNGGGAGSVTMAFQTRSGTNRLSGSAYEYYRDPRLNTNYYFNTVNGLSKNNVKLNQYGARLGGPVVIPGLFNGRDKLFFFAHYERIVFPNTFSRARTVYNSRSTDGWFRYQCSTGTCEVNVLTLAAANGQISTKDPIMGNILKMIEDSMKTTGVRAPGSDPLFDTYTWPSPSQLVEAQPTFRMDWNINTRNRLSASFSAIKASRTPDYLNSADPRFPGAPNHRDFVSARPLATLSLRSVLGKSLTNEFRAGANSFGKGSNFGFPSALESGNAPSSFKDEGGFAIVSPSTTDWYTSNSPSWRTAPTYSFDETLTWLFKTHTITGGASLLISNAKSGGEYMVPYAYIGLDTTYDPAAGMFSGSAGAANFPGASSSNLTAARNLYAVLTGRVTTISTNYAVDPASGKFVENGPYSYDGGYKQYSVYLQDSWKLLPTLTITGGLRYDLQTPFAPSRNAMTGVTMAGACGASGLGAGGTYSKCQFNTPGVRSNVVPQFDELTKGTLGYKTDTNNIGPSLSLAWRPNIQKGFFRALLGDPDQATIRAGYSVGFDRQGLTTFTSLYGSNPGLTTSASRTANIGNLVNPGEAWPLVLSQTSRMSSPQLASTTPAFPIAIRTGRQDSINLFAPDIQIGRMQNWMIGFARSISKDMAIEFRYIANKGDNEWSALNYNSIRGDLIQANGFMSEFKLAMANLKANNAFGGARAGSFAYFGSGTGTSPLPIYLAYLNGSTDFNNAAAYIPSSSTWSSSTLAGYAVLTNPNPTSAAATLVGTSAYLTNAATAGYPANFFLLNPVVSSVNVTDSGAKTDYNAFQVELRRRLSKGFSASINYQLAYAGVSAFDGFSFGRGRVPQTENAIRHAIKMQADFQVPIGKGQKIGGNMSTLLDAVVGGWSFTAVGRMQSLTMDFGNVQLVGMTTSDLQKMYKYYYKAAGTTASGVKEIWMLPDDVILNTRRAFSTASTTANGYSTSLGAPSGRYIAPANTESCIQVRPGDCAPRSVVVMAPWFYRFDVAAIKRIPIKGRINIELRVDVLNVLDTPNFNNVANPGTSATIFKVTSAYSDASNTYDPGGRIGQLMLRINW